MPEKHLVTTSDDGLPIEEVGSWVEDKYRLVALYNKLFSTGMKKKWEVRVYIDLYAGPGYSRVEGTNRILWGSPLLALGVPDKFDKYIFCESNPSFLDALRQRVNRVFPEADADFVLGDCNERKSDIVSRIPRYSQQRRVLSFCFIDPYDLSIRFSTIRELCSSYLVDFLVLLALHMDANRNVPHYTNPGIRKLDDFLELPDWREKWEGAQLNGFSFPRFLGEEFAKQMETLQYLPTAFDKMKAVRSDVNNLPLYHLALFSRHPLAYEYWDEVLRYSTDQRSFEFS